MSLQAETILDNASIGIIGIDHHCIVQYANSYASRLLNHDLSTGTSFKSIDLHIGRQVLSCMEQGINNQIFYIKKYQGGIEVHVSLMTNGKVGAICLLRDLEAVEASSLDLPNIMDAQLQFQILPDDTYYGIYILDGKGIVLKVNDVAAGLVGLKKEKMIGMNIQSLVDDGIIDQALTPVILKSKKPLSLPLYVIKSNKYILASGMPIFNKNGDILFVVVIEHDITIIKELRTQLEQAKQITDTIKSELSDRNLLELKNSEIIADSPEMKQVLTVLLKLAKMDVSNILITGDSGTGKGFLSKFIHHNGIRKDKPFISINCATLPEMLLEAELFGYEKGAFTGASDSGKTGLFELANQGTIFLDEIGDLPFSVQAKLLKCLDEGEIRRLGGTKEIKVDCIIIAATNHNLEDLVRRKKFRQDLYFRLNIFPVQVPSLRDRREDILKISIFYLNKYNKMYKQKKQFSERCIELLQAYDFPGNVRELKNIIKNAVVIKEKKVLGNILPPNRRRLNVIENLSSDKRDVSPDKGLNEMLLEFERKKLVRALNKSDSTRDLSERLRISQSTVVRKLKKHGLSMD